MKETLQMCRQASSSVLQVSFSFFAAVEKYCRNLVQSRRDSEPSGLLLRISSLDERGHSAVFQAQFPPQHDVEEPSFGCSSEKSQRGAAGRQSMTASEVARTNTLKVMHSNSRPGPSPTFKQIPIHNDETESLTHSSTPTTHAEF